MTNEPKPNDEGSDFCTLTFGNETIKIKPTPQKVSVRYLGVWYNMLQGRSHVLDQVKNKLYIASDKLRRKLVTDKQMTYIFNTVLLPRIEFWTQITAIKEHECNQRMRPFYSAFK